MNDIPIVTTSREACGTRQRPVITGPWRLAHLTTAPHRLGFTAAALVMALAALWWATMLVARSAGWSVPWAVSPLIAHGALMSLGFMPLFIVGFLFTAGPRWLHASDVSAGVLRTPVALMLTGWLIALPGIHISAALATLGVTISGIGWTVLAVKFALLWRSSDAPDKRHAGMISMACGFGTSAFVLLVYGLGADSFASARAGVYLALWGFLAPTFATVCHRMIPFFTASALPTITAWRPMWLLWLMVVPLWLQGGFSLWQLWSWPLPGLARWVQVGIELPAAIIMLWLALHWGLIQSLKNRLLAMLHVSFVWLGISLLLAGISHAMMANSADAVSLGLAPVHALTIGYLWATMIAMTTRVAAGHSGRPLTADNLAWTLFWCVQLTAILRISAELMPAWHEGLNLLAILCWGVAAIGWAIRYGNWFGRPRIDGQPG